ncbi:protein phosphatase PTC1, partial [Tremellales sp. Uapishka_1]
MPSTLAKHHPDHPTLDDLDLSPQPRMWESSVVRPLPSTLHARRRKEPEKVADDACSSDSFDLDNGTHAGSTTTTPVSISDTESSSSHSNSIDQPTAMDFRRPSPSGFADSPNARSKSVTVAAGENTFGALNCHPSGNNPPPPAPVDLAGQVITASFRVGVSEDKNKRCRRTMEDSHSFVYDYAGIKGQGYFAVFDGHAGKHAAEWCGQNFHEVSFREWESAGMNNTSQYLLDALLTQTDRPIPDVLNKTFHVVDSRLSHLASTGRTQSGCTAVTAFLRIEHADSTEGFINPGLTPRGLMEGRGEDELEAQTQLAPHSRRSSSGAGSGGGIGGVSATGGGLGRRMSGRRIRDFVKGLTGTTSGDRSKDDEAVEDEDAAGKVDAIEPRSERGLKRVLYTANVGDARGVLCRGGKAVRLTYDHKGSDSQEAKRITDAGGFVMNNRVNGVLAVTRSLGDASMKEFVVGSPYTTETTLDDLDEFLIVACDGLWDVCEDQEAVDIIRSTKDPQDASKRLLDHALNSYSTDNLSVMVIRFSTA